MGQYLCSVSSWSVTGQGDMVNTAVHQSSQLAVRWDTKREETSFICCVLKDYIILQGMHFFSHINR